VKKIIITSYARTAIGTFLGSLKDVLVEVLGAMQSRRNSRKMYSEGAGNV
jgi:acetyl-CoA acetyltransferase